MKTQAWLDRKDRTGFVRCEVCGGRLPHSEMAWVDKRGQSGTCRQCSSILTGKTDTKAGGEA